MQDNSAVQGNWKPEDASITAVDIINALLAEVAGLEAVLEETLEETYIWEVEFSLRVDVAALDLDLDEDECLDCEDEECEENPSATSTPCWSGKHAQGDVDRHSCVSSEAYAEGVALAFVPGSFVFKGVRLAAWAECNPGRVEGHLRSGHCGAGRDDHRAQSAMTLRLGNTAAIASPWPDVTHRCRPRIFTVVCLPFPRYVSERAGADSVTTGENLLS